MLLGAPVMVAFMGDGGDNRRLAIVPADGGYSGESSQRRARAIRRDQKTRAHGWRALDLRFEGIAALGEALDGRLEDAVDAEPLA